MVAPELTEDALRPGPTGRFIRSGAGGGGTAERDVSADVSGMPEGLL